MKLFKKNKPRAELTRTESLACIPQKSPGVTWQKLENGDLRLEYPLTLKPFFIKLVERWHKGEQERPTRKIELDKFGSMVWEIIDGEKTVAGITKEFAAGSGLSLTEAEISVVAFLRQLGRRGLILLK